MSRRVRFNCCTEQIPVEEMSGTATDPKWKTQKHAAWAYQPDGSVDFADTPSRWVFGKTMCLRAIGGGHEEKYEKCPPG